MEQQKGGGVLLLPASEGARGHPRRWTRMISLAAPGIKLLWWIPES